MKFQREEHHLFFTAHDEIEKRATIRNTKKRVCDSDTFEELE